MITIIKKNKKKKMNSKTGPIFPSKIVPMKRKKKKKKKKKKRKIKINPK